MKLSFIRGKNFSIFDLFIVSLYSVLHLTVHGEGEDSYIICSKPSLLAINVFQDWRRNVKIWEHERKCLLKYNLNVYETFTTAIKLPYIRMYLLPKA